MIIYAITQLSTGKQYIGATKNYGRRVIVHRSLLRSGKHDSASLQQACNGDPLGVDGFKFTVLEETTADLLRERERALIREYKPVFNQLGVIAPSSEWRKKISIAKSGIPKSQTSIQKRLQTLKEHGPIRWSNEARAKMSASRKGKPMPPRSREHAENISKALSGRTQSLEQKRAARIGQLRRFGHSEEAIQKRLKELYG